MNAEVIDDFAFTDMKTVTDFVVEFHVTFYLLLSLKSGGLN